MPELVIQDIPFQTPERYKEGHVLTALEAAALNQTRYENLMNNFAGKVKKLKKETGDQPTAEQIANLQAEFVSYEETYTFRGKALSKQPQDPVTKMALKLAKEKVLEALRKKNIDPKTLEDGHIDDLANEASLKNPAFREEAKRRIEAMQNMSDNILDLSGV